MYPRSGGDTQNTEGTKRMRILPEANIQYMQGRRNWGGQEGQPPPLPFIRRGKGGKGALSI